MSARPRISHGPVNAELTLRDRAGAPLGVQARDLAITRLAERIVEYRLTIEVTLEQYRRIDADALFHLSPELRGQCADGDFLPRPDIEIEIDLKEELLPLVEESALEPASAVIQLLELNAAGPESPLFQTESWLGLYVKQARYGMKSGYRTTWSKAAEELRASGPAS